LKFFLLIHSGDVLAQIPRIGEFVNATWPNETVVQDVVQVALQARVSLKNSVCAAINDPLGSVNLLYEMVTVNKAVAQFNTIRNNFQNLLVEAGRSGTSVTRGQLLWYEIKITHISDENKIFYEIK
jgi:hypothetical protein